ncbi:hypothetical protein BDZ94DRAFT_296655 [Collybia nuda]|uniref:Uncharacterized protein n=1 Tax=Collybia nuda TaxID=64659 RepID=A0A9P6CGU6_9AGAR|nr:hypothetical protein BDZ94DRAFT_296655 [Collybia nuda]
MINYKSDRRKAQEHRETLRLFLDTIRLQSSLSVQETLHRLATQHAEIIAGLRRQRNGPGTGRTNTEQGGKQDSKSATDKPANQAMVGSEPQGHSGPMAGAISSLDPFRNEPRQEFPNIGPSSFSYAQHQVSVTAIDGDVIVCDTSRYITNSNSGNTSTTMVMGSHNDSAVRIIPGYCGEHRLTR